MTQNQLKDLDRDWPIVNLKSAVIDVCVDIRKPTQDEIYSIELERDRLSRYLEKHRAREDA